VDSLTRATLDALPERAMTLPTTAPADPYAALGLPVTRKLTDRRVRRAWLKRALATSPDRGKAGDPDAYRAAWDAYQLLGTAMGRSATHAGVLAGLEVPPVAEAALAGPPAPLTVAERVTLLPRRIRYGSFRRFLGRLGLCLLTARLAHAFLHSPWIWLALAGLALVALFGSNDLAPLPRQPAASQPEPARAAGMPAAPPGPAERLAS
jgi:hypothetical protein